MNAFSNYCFKDFKCAICDHDDHDFFKVQVSSASPGRERTNCIYQVPSGDNTSLAYQVPRRVTKKKTQISNEDRRFSRGGNSTSCTTN